jgi:hypothetical protein
MEPTEARKPMLPSSASSSRCRVAFMARRAPSSWLPASSWRSRSFMNSRMPLANSRSIGPVSGLLLAAR